MFTASLTAFASTTVLSSTLTAYIALAVLSFTLTSFATTAVLYSILTAFTALAVLAITLTTFGTASVLACSNFGVRRPAGERFFRCGQ